jgi:hypothetical protein
MTWKRKTKKTEEKNGAAKHTRPLATVDLEFMGCKYAIT